ncbi:MAG: hypothetical protein VW258_04755 [Thalassolituus sp.]
MKTLKTSFRLLSLVLPLSVVTLVGCGGVDEPEPETLAECLSGEWSKDYSVVNTYDGTTDNFHHSYRFNDDGTIELRSYADVINWDDLWVDNETPLFDWAGPFGDVAEFLTELVGGGDEYLYREGTWSASSEDSYLTLTLADTWGASPYGYTFAKWNFNQKVSSDDSDVTQVVTSWPVNCKSDQFVINALESDHGDTIEGLWTNSTANVNVSLETESVGLSYRGRSDKRGYDLLYSAAGYSMAACFTGLEENPRRWYDRSLVRVDLSGNSPRIEHFDIPEPDAAVEVGDYLYYVDGTEQAGRYRLSDGSTETFTLPGSFYNRGLALTEFDSGIGFLVHNADDYFKGDLYLLKNDGTAAQFNSVVDDTPVFNNHVLTWMENDQVYHTNLSTSETQPFFVADKQERRFIRDWVSDWDGHGYYYHVANLSSYRHELWYQPGEAETAIFIADLAKYDLSNVGQAQMRMLNETTVLYITRVAGMNAKLSVYNMETRQLIEHDADWPVDFVNLGFIHQGPQPGSIYLSFNSSATLWLLHADSSLSQVWSEEYFATNTTNHEKYISVAGRLYFMGQDGGIEHLSRYDEYNPVRLSYLSDNLYFQNDEGAVFRVTDLGDVVRLDEELIVISGYNPGLYPYEIFSYQSGEAGREIAAYWPESGETFLIDALDVYGLSSGSFIIDRSSTSMLMLSYWREAVCDGPYAPLIMEDGQLWYDTNYRPVYGQGVYRR